jgi:hypothetical protein
VKAFDEAVPSDLTGAFQRLNRQMTHLAKTRTTTEKLTTSDARMILAWLEAALRRFRDALAPEDREHWAKAVRGPPTTLETGKGQFATNAILTTQSSTSLFAEMKVVGISK